MGPPKTVLITGCNRGIGLGLVKEFLKVDKVNKIIATCRNKAKAEELVSLESNSRLKVLELDVAKYEDDYKDFVAQVSEELGSDGLNLLINNAGIIGEIQSLGDLTSEAMIETYKVNCIAPTILARALLPLLKKVAKPDAGFGCDNAAIIQMSTSVASIAENGFGGMYPYRCSKTALNMAMKNVSLELKKDGILVLSLHPGWVKTDMGGSNAQITVEECVSAMVRTLCQLSDKDHGAFIRYNNTPVAW
ncbi:C-signal [Lepeophtheirus salmonis]|uniref:C-factor n=1 Tax=Lepeophtheirus salmonis TaxID=72036 RepID=C1BV29_LEPSM|nr:C-factor-like [Lepeophtheirus salmonis]ACO12882.1 C-factor [Lepeophtheirus salmonis]